MYLYNTQSTAKKRGKEGELIVRKLLKKLDKNQYKVLNDLAFNIKGKISQIDHVVISDFGIFVIETKNYKGTIIGDETKYNWTQVILNYKNKFYNPILQNRGHIYALKYVLKKYDDDDLISIVTFTKRARLKVKSTTSVVYTNSLLKTIRSKKIKVLTGVEQEKIFKTIQSKNLNK